MDDKDASYVTENSDEYSAHSNPDYSESSSTSSSSVSVLSAESCISIEEEWSSYLKEDGSLTFIESYLASTVKEKHADQLVKTNLEIGLERSEKKFVSPSPRKTIKHHTRLLSLLKRRPSVRLKNYSVNIDNQNRHIPSSSGGFDSVSPKVTFRDTPSGEVRRITLKVSIFENKYGRRASLCESMLGIMPGRFNEPPDSRIMVAGLAPGSQALKDGIIKIGDWLKEVDNKEITWENLDNTLLDIQIPSDITLIVLKCASETLPPENLDDEKRLPQTRLVKLISGHEPVVGDWNSKCENGELPLHTVLYLSLKGVTESSNDKEDIKYQFPHSSNKLVQVRGMFITTSHSLQEVVSSHLLSCSITLEGEHYFIAFCREDNDVFLIAVPHEYISRSDIVILMEQISKLIVYEFGSLSSAMTNPSNRNYLDHIFFLLMDDIFRYKERSRISIDGRSATTGDVTLSEPTFFLDDFSNFKAAIMYSSPSWLTLNDSASKIQIETCLNELESGDFGEDESDCEDCQLLYNILGCCIFYKGSLVTSHLDTGNLQKVWLFAHHHRLLELLRKEAVSQLILWNRVFPEFDLEEDAVPSPAATRHYLLIVAMNHILLAMLVESGNVTELLDEKDGPDPYLVDQAETTLYHLHSLHVHAACEESFCNGNIETASFDEKRGFSSPSSKQNRRKNIDILEDSRHPDVPSILKQKSPQPESPLHVHDFPSCDCERGSPGSSPPCSKNSSFLLPEDDDEADDDTTTTTFDSEFRILKGHESRSGFAYSPDVSGFGSKCLNGISPMRKHRLTVGGQNVLLHFIQLDIGDGIVITPLSHCAQEADSLHAQLLHNFYVSCSHVRQVLRIGLRNKSVGGNYVGTSVMNNIKEYGIMFESSVSSAASSGIAQTGKKKNHTIAYWVIGRIYGPPYEREIYVAVEDSIPQNIQEIAFKLSLQNS